MLDCGEFEVRSFLDSSATVVDVVASTRLKEFSYELPYQATNSASVGNKGEGFNAVFTPLSSPMPIAR